MISHRLNKYLYLDCTRFMVSVAFFSFLVLSLNIASAQRITYQDLLERNDEPNLYIDHFLLPAPESNTDRFVTTFRIDFELLQFKKHEAADKSAASPRKASSFKATPHVSMELYSADKPYPRSKFKDVEYQKLKPVTRKFWKHTVYVDTYQQTKSNRNHLSGYFKAKVNPGLHRMLWQLNQSKGNKPVTRTRVIRIPKTGKNNPLPFYYIDSLDNQQRPEKAAIINFGDNVYFGKDFHLLFQLPSNNADLTLIVNKIKIQNKDTTNIETVFTRSLGPSEILTNTVLSLENDSTKLWLDITSENAEGRNYGLVKIPNSKFENSKYQVLLKDTENDKVLSRDFFQSRWINMPTSLLNIEVSIRMLHYILDDSKIEKMSKGSREKQIQKFRDFWKQKDPTPETAYNELMTEYYRRIDHAYEKFGSINQPGFETDMGKIYIRRGPPDKIERRFPSGQRAVVTWKYSDKTYVFQATSGFGDFKLVSEK